MARPPHPRPLRLYPLLCAGVALSAAVSGCAPVAPRPLNPEELYGPQLPVLDHTASVRCDALSTPRGPLRCDVHVEVSLAQPVPALAQEGLEVELFYHRQRLLPAQVSADGRLLTFTASVARPEIDFTAAVRDISPIEARHPVTVARWMAPTFPISYRANALWGAPLHLTIDLPAEVTPEDLWLSLDFDASGPGRHILREERADQGFSASFLGPSRYTLGGPTLGVGCYIGGAPTSPLQRCPMVAVGWEGSAPDWLLYQATVETNFTSALNVVPSIEANAWVEDWGPGFRVGLPVEVVPTPRVGLRALITYATWSTVGAIGVDYFPFQPDQGSVLNTVIQVQFSL